VAFLEVGVESVAVLVDVALLVEFIKRTAGRTSVVDWHCVLCVGDGNSVVLMGSASSELLLLVGDGGVSFSSDSSTSLLVFFQIFHQIRVFFRIDDRGLLLILRHVDNFSILAQNHTFRRGRTQFFW